jgi:hypothetical protein
MIGSLIYLRSIRACDQVNGTIRDPQISRKLGFKSC